MDIEQRGTHHSYYRIVLNVRSVRTSGAYFSLELFCAYFHVFCLVSEILLFFFPYPPTKSPLPHSQPQRCPTPLKKRKKVSTKQGCGGRFDRNNPEPQQPTKPVNWNACFPQTVIYFSGAFRLVIAHKFQPKTSRVQPETSEGLNNQPAIIIITSIMATQKGSQDYPIGSIYPETNAKTHSL